MNIVWFVPALVGFAMVLLTVKRSYPPSPPSRSAQLNCSNSPDFSYLKTLWILMRNLPCMILTLTIGKVFLLIDCLLAGVCPLNVDAGSSGKDPFSTFSSVSTNTNMQLWMPGSSENTEAGWRG